MGNQRGGGFPRVTIVGGTTITSNRTYSDDILNKVWWDGQFSAPSSTRLPEVVDITFTSMKRQNSMQVAAAFIWGLSNESFDYSPAAKIVLPVDEIDGQKLWVAYETDDKWDIDGDSFCVAKDGLCFLDVTAVDSLALVRELHAECPVGSVENGDISNAPLCIITCDRNYELNEKADGCVEEGFVEEGLDEIVGDEVVDDLEEPFLSLEEEEATVYEFPEGYFRYQGSAEKSFRYLDEEVVEGDNLDRVRNLNRSYFSSNPRSTEDQILPGEAASADKTNDNKDGFLNYILQMRNSFGVGSNSNVVLSGSTEEGADGNEEESLDGEEEGDLHGTAPLLPSTGPEIFAVIAILGLLMMFFGVRRKN